MPNPVPASIWTRTMDALQAAQGWALSDPQHLADLQGAITRAQGRPEKINPSDARDILAIVSDPRAAKYFGPGKWRQEAILAGLKSILQPRANLAAQIPAPLRQKDSFIAKAGAPKIPEPTIVTDEGIRLRKKGTARAGVRESLRRKGRGQPLLRVGGDGAQVLGVRADAFGHAMRGILNQKFDGDAMLMAKRTRLRYAECDAYLYGHLPTTFGDVVALEARIGVRHGTLADPWLADHMTLLEAHHPLSKSSDPIVDNLTLVPKRKLARLVRLAVLRLATGDALISVVNSTAGDKGTDDYLRLLKLFDAEFPVTAAPLKRVYDFIVGSGAATEGETRAAIGLYVNAVEKWEERIVGSPVLDQGGNEFDHRHVDVLDVAENMERGDGSVSLLLFAPSFLDPWEIAEASAEGTADFATMPTYLRKASRFFVSPDPDLVVRPLSSMMASTEEMVLRAEKSRAIDKVLSTLWPQEQSVLGLMFGYGFTEEEVGRELGLNTRSVLQIEAHALRRLRRPFLAKQLEPFLREPEKLEDLMRLERARRWFEQKDKTEKLDNLRRLERARRWFEEKDQAATRKGEKPKPEDDDPDDRGGKGGTPAPSGQAGSGSSSPAGQTPPASQARSASSEEPPIRVGGFCGHVPVLFEGEETELPPEILGNEMDYLEEGADIMTGTETLRPVELGIPAEMMMTIPAGMGR